jgi:pyrroloquinoline quinone (PQQ) biosynthesis protein C
VREALRNHGETAEHPGTAVSDRLNSALAEYRKEYNSVFNGWLGDDASFGVAYPAFLVETYHYVRHSCFLMEEALARTPADREVICEYWKKHIKEEVGHEEWAVNDLGVLGYSKTDVVRSEPLPETVTLIGGQMFMVQRVNPISLLGYAYMMETKPPDSRFLVLISETFSIPRSAMTFLFGHADADVAHAVELKELVNTIVTESEVRSVITSAVLGLSCINSILSRLRRGMYVDGRPEVQRKWRKSRSATLGG